MRSSRMVAAFVVFAFGMMVVSSRGADATFAGKYSDGNLTIDLAPSADGYAGTFSLHGQQFPATARANDLGLAGLFAGRRLTAFCHRLASAPWIGVLPWPDHVRLHAASAASRADWAASKRSQRAATGAGDGN